MKRKFLEDLELEKEVVDKIMAENGSDIEKANCVVDLFCIFYILNKRLLT